MESFNNIDYKKNEFKEIILENIDFNKNEFKEIN